MADRCDPEILFDRRGAAGLVTLNRPQALHAVTYPIVRALAQKLAEWADDGAVTRVIVTAAGGRAFSAGGDLRELYERGRAGRFDQMLAFWRDEYRLVALIKRYRKPYVALIDGVIMGGGVGLAIHGSHRVAGDGFRFAMPEAGIGFFPDVGASWFLPRLPGELGTIAASPVSGSTGRPVATGVATHRVSSARFPDLIEALCGNVSVDAQLGAFAAPAGEGAVMGRRSALDRLFVTDQMEGVLAALDAEAAGGEAAGNSADAAFARTTAALLRTRSPTSLKVTLALLRRGRILDFDQCMRTEFRVASRLAKGHDLYEGIRSVIIDKDRTPRWQPSSLQSVSQGDVGAFAPIAAELDLP